MKPRAIPCQLWHSFGGKFAINYALNFRLKQGQALLAIAAGNIAKMAAFATLAISIKVNLFVAVAVLIVFSHAAKRVIEKMLARGR